MDNYQDEKVVPDKTQIKPRPMPEPKKRLTRDEKDKIGKEMYQTYRKTLDDYYYEDDAKENITKKTKAKKGENFDDKIKMERHSLDDLDQVGDFLGKQADDFIKNLDNEGNERNWMKFKKERAEKGGCGGGGCKPQSKHSTYAEKRKEIEREEYE